MHASVVILPDHEHVEWACMRSFGRTSEEARHGYASQSMPAACDAWQFPLVNSAWDPGANADTNDVTFVYPEGSYGGPPDARVELICTATGLFQRVPLYRLRDTRYMIVTLRVPRAQSHRYKFIVHGTARLDPANPQLEVTLAGEEWSRFFTWGFNQPVSFEPWEICILDRLTRHILPFNNAEARNYLKRVSANVVTNLYRLDDDVGATNYIDKLVAREERQHLETYHTCLEMIDRILRKRNPYEDPDRMQEAMYIELYEHLSESQPHYRTLLGNDGWDFERYKSPKHFLGLLRRHTWTGAFSHPKYGGNAGGTGWMYLSSRYPFEWGRITEAPLGQAVDGYRG